MKSELEEISKSKNLTQAATSAGRVRADVIRVGLVGATGYAGRELLALLGRHPGARVTRLMSSGRRHTEPLPIEKIHPSLRGEVSIPCHPLEEGALRPETQDVVFLGTPPEVSMELAPRLVERGLRVVDLSGAFRLQDIGQYPIWYGFEHTATEHLKQAVYGVPELDGEAVAAARFVANPGCYATAIILALAPLVQSGWLLPQTEIICDAKSGVSGAGRAPSEKTHYVEANESCSAYGLFRHRHVPEILQTLNLKQEGFRFTPHLVPLTRGILASLYLRLDGKRSREEVAGLFKKFFKSASMVRFYEDSTLPEIKAVQGTNYCDIGFSLEAATGRLTVVSCIDNLGKGAAGQALQNMNLMFGLPEETGLR